MESEVYENELQEEILEDSGVVEETAAEKKKSDIEEFVELLQKSGMESPPTVEVIEAWKAKYRNIRTLTVAPDAIFIFRTLTREEYRQISSMPSTIRRAKENATDSEIQNAIEDEVCKKAILYPYNVLDFIDSFGGLAKTLSDQITIESYFIPVEIASAFVTKL